MDTNNVTMKTASKLYEVFEGECSGTGKKVMLSILRHMEKELNTVIIGGDTLNQITFDTGLSRQQVRDKVSELKRLELIESTKRLKAEYVVCPTFAFKGYEDKVWKFYGTLENQAKEITCEM